MRSFNCDSCGAKLFFENDTCLNCGRTVGFRPDTLAMCTAETARTAGLQQCRNWTDFNACNWFAASNVPHDYCLACGLNEIVPDLTDPQRLELWTATERAKRRLIYTLLRLELPLAGGGDKKGLRFRLLADRRVDTGEIDPPADEPVYIGHENGRLTVNVIEADDAHREAMRKRLNEPNRTMLGHLRHEIGHFYWYLLVEGTPLRDEFRELFGTERADYAAALETHYQSGGAAGWQRSFVSAYASAHPWEDFAETWAHYLQIVDTLETASDCSMSLGGRAIAPPLPLRIERPFADILADWLPLSICLNQLNRSMGVRDAYPFALPNRVTGKLAFVHRICLAAVNQGPASRVVSG